MSPTSAAQADAASPRYRARRFRYQGFEVDPVAGSVRGHYLLDDLPFTESVSFPAGGEWESPAVQEAARLIFLLSGISYYKAGAPPVIDLGTVAVRETERALLESFYTAGLGEFAYRNRLDLEIEFTGGRPGGPPAPFRPRPRSPLVPFGGGIDSIVSVEMIRSLAEDPSLFVVSAGGSNFASIDAAAATSGIEVVRATRHLDPAILRPPAHWLNGHVPVTGILSALAVLAAALGGHDAVVMSNEWSASAGNTVVDGRSINHQWSKSAAFEDGFRAVLDSAFDSPPDYFSLLRSASTLWIARRFAQLDRYHPVFRSCNRAFHIDPGRRQAKWCGECDKCCFVDLILSPFLSPQDLNRIFDGHEPLGNPALEGQFAVLCGLSEDPKPFECVGDADECRAALTLAAARPDRRSEPVLKSLIGRAGAAIGAGEPESLFRSMGPHHVPEPYAAALDLD